MPKLEILDSLEIQLCILVDSFYYTSTYFRYHAVSYRIANTKNRKLRQSRTYISRPWSCFTLTDSPSGFVKVVFLKQKYQWSAVVHVYLDMDVYESYNVINKKNSIHVVFLQYNWTDQLNNYLWQFKHPSNNTWRSHLKIIMQTMSLINGKLFEK